MLSHEAEVDGKPFRILKMRDGMNAKKYCDEQSISHKLEPFDNDKWPTKELSSRIKMDDDPDDETFYMGFDEYFHAFRSTIICC